MTREWKPGDLAMVTAPFKAGGRREVAAVRCHDGWQQLDTGAHAYSGDVIDARPLVVIDPVEITGPDETTEGGDPVWEIANCLMRLAERDGASATQGTYRGRVAARLSASFAEVVAPEKPAEPLGLGAVVEDVDGHLHTRAREHNWPWVGSDGQWRGYGAIAAVRVLHEGVTP